MSPGDAKRENSGRKGFAQQSAFEVSSESLRLVHSEGAAQLRQPLDHAHDGRPTRLPSLLTGKGQTTWEKHMTVASWSP